VEPQQNMTTAYLTAPTNTTRLLSAISKNTWQEIRKYRTF